MQAQLASAIFFGFPEGKQWKQTATLWNSPRPKRTRRASPASPTHSRMRSSQRMLAPPAENAERQDGIRRRRAVHTAKLAGGKLQGFAKQVLLYCFRFRKCGTFMPLSGVRGESRIAVVWTLLFAVPIRFHRFTSAFCYHSVVLYAVGKRMRHNDICR